MGSYHGDMTSIATWQRDYRRIEQAIEYLAARPSPPPTLAELAASVGLSEFHFQRLFRRWAGISPKRFFQCLIAQRARERLIASRSVLDATLAAGVSSPGRLHDLMVTIHAATPGDIRTGGKGLHIDYAVHASPFGECFVAVTPRGICAFEFLGPVTRRQALQNLRASWPNALLREQPRSTQFVMSSLRQPHRQVPLPLLVRGTNFQVKVWEALARIPEGHVWSYEDVARVIGQPMATRAVASAIANNAIALFIPCHRVIRKTGVFGEYRWGATRKRALVAFESTRR
jgi:AraC family transcriptional regulator, regulatory protein of adaptative response / methylated-DNA-[protein]-cysteine methyltransferase